MYSILHLQRQDWVWGWSALEIPISSSCTLCIKYQKCIKNSSIFSWIQSYSIPRVIPPCKYQHNGYDQTGPPIWLPGQSDPCATSRKARCGSSLVDVGWDLIRLRHGCVLIAAPSLVRHPVEVGRMLEAEKGMCMKNEKCVERSLFPVHWY